MSNSDKISVAIVQHPPVFLNLNASVAEAVRFIREAGALGAQVIVFPETWLPGYPVWLDLAPKAAFWDYPPAKALYRTLVENAVTLGGEALRELRQAAAQAGAYVVMGAHERLGGTLYNTMLTLGPDGQEMQVHRKLIPTYTERLVWGRGDGSTLGVMATPFGNLGGLICWEHWMPLPRAAMHEKGEVVHVAQWPSAHDLHQLASRHYAFEGQCFVLAAGTYLRRGDVLDGFRSLGVPDSPAWEILDAMPGDDVIHSGGSAVIGPDTSYVTGPLVDASGILAAELDPARITEGHFTLDTDGHYARPDVFRLEVDERPQVGVVRRRD
jgi:nitrilase